jgi:hypothetical protein
MTKWRLTAPEAIVGTFIELALSSCERHVEVVKAEVVRA